MAKDNPESKTVPVYDASGNQIGMTTPEKAAANQSNPDLAQYNLSYGTSPASRLSLGGAAPAPTSPYSNELQKTGTWDDNSKVTMFDPITGEYITKNVDPNNLMEFNPRGDQSMWGNANGEHQLIYTGGEGARDTGAMVNDGPGMDGMTWEWGATPQTYPEHTGPLSLGGPPTGNQPPPTQPPVTQPPAAQPPVAQPSAPTDDWYPTDPVGYQGAPQPTGDGSFDPGGPPPDTSWDWSYFRDKAPGDRQWGGYDEDYQAFERYQPGMDSPWGMPNVEGGNKDFYQQQFVNLLRDEQGFQNRERAAQARRQDAFENPYEAAPTDWSWANSGQGLKDVQIGTGGPSRVATGEYETNPAYSWDSSTTGSQILSDIMPILSDAEKTFTNKHPEYFDQLDLSGGREGVTAWQQGNPNPNDKGWSNVLSKIATNIYQPTYTDSGPAAPVGYAAPI